MGTISLGIGIRLTRGALSTTEVVPLAHASVKELYGTRPQSTNTGKFLTGLGKILVNTNVRAPIMTKGFRTDQRTPKDMFLYLIRKSLRTRFSRRKTESPRHILTIRCRRFHGRPRCHLGPKAPL